MPLKNKKVQAGRLNQFLFFTNLYYWGIKDKYRQQLLKMQIDKGELSAIALVLEIANSAFKYRWGQLLLFQHHESRKIRRFFRYDL